MLKRKKIIDYNATGSALALFSFMSSKKGMLANLIGGFIVVLIGVSLMGPIAQEINNIYNCVDGNSSISNSSLPETGDPLGSTDSFGGGGANHFGGYDGTVKHNSFLQQVADTSLVKTDKSIFDPNCNLMNTNSSGLAVIKLVPGFFALAMLGAGIAIAYGLLRREYKPRRRK